MLTFSSYFNIEESPTNKEMMSEAFSAIKEEKDSAHIGYYELPTHTLTSLEKLKKINTEHIEQVVVIGIGGSSLGIKAIDSILRPHTDAKEILFLENSDPLTLSETMKNIRKDKASFFMISKSGSTIETTSTLKTLINHFDLDLDGADRESVFVITNEGSVLSDFAKYHKLYEFNIPDNVGGRFSVLSAVGAIPLAVAGYDIEALLGGAGSFMEKFFERGEDHVLQKACWLASSSQTQNINLLFSYADRLEDLTKWYIQLWGESLGKIDSDGERVGLTPIGLIGAVDQHSFLQLIIEGPRDKSVTFIKIEDFGVDLDIPDITLKGIEKTDFINGKSFNHLINAQCDATMQSVIESGVEADMVTIDKVTPENIGALLAYYELLTSIVGDMLRVDVYNQPGVELGKQILYKNLEKQ